VIRVLIADDQALVRGGFRLILDTQKDLTVVGEAENGLQAVDLAATLRPDVVLMDIRMPVLDGIHATRRLMRADPALRVLILTTFQADEYVYEAMKAGASGFLLKDVRPERLVDAVRTVAEGEALLAPAITRRLVEQFVQRPAPGARALERFSELTARELDVLRLIAQGRSNLEVGDELQVSEATVKTHVTHILQRVGAADRTQAALWAERHLRPARPEEGSS
jgi:DNA-binding NarL/FixJ family response regulator